MLRRRVERDCNGFLQAFAPDRFVSNVSRQNQNWWLLRDSIILSYIFPAIQTTSQKRFCIITTLTAQPSLTHLKNSPWSTRQQNATKDKILFLSRVALQRSPLCTCSNYFALPFHRSRERFFFTFSFVRISGALRWLMKHREFGERRPLWLKV